MMKDISRYTNLFARLLLGVLFLVSGAMKIAGWSMVVGMAAAKGLPFPAFTIGLAAALEIIGAMLLIFGVQTRTAAIALFVYLIPTTLLFHNFWAAQGPAEQMQLVNFLKNLGIMGGLLLVAAEGSATTSPSVRPAESN